MSDNRINSENASAMKGSMDRVEPKSVARLLGITLDHGGGTEDNSDEMMAELLGARLAGTWLSGAAPKGAWSKLVRQLLGRDGANGRRSVGTVLLDPRAPLGTIKLIRDRAKAQAAKESHEAEHAVMTMIYFAAIANALAYRKVKITTYSYESLEASFEKLIRKTWIPAAFGELFHRATKVCQEEHLRRGSRHDESLSQS